VGGVDTTGTIDIDIEFGGGDIALERELILVATDGQVSFIAGELAFQVIDFSTNKPIPNSSLKLGPLLEVQTDATGAGLIGFPPGDYELGIEIPVMGRSWGVFPESFPTEIGSDTPLIPIDAYPLIYGGI